MIILIRRQCTAVTINYICCVLIQDHNVEGEQGVKDTFAKLHDDMQEAFRKLEE